MDIKHAPSQDRAFDAPSASRETYRIEIRSGNIHALVGNSNDSVIKFGTIHQVETHAERMGLQVTQRP